MYSARYPKMEKWENVNWEKLRKSHVCARKCIIFRKTNNTTQFMRYFYPSDNTEINTNKVLVCRLQEWYFLCASSKNDKKQQKHTILDAWYFMQYSWSMWMCDMHHQCTYLGNLFFCLKHRHLSGAIRTTTFSEK